MPLQASMNMNDELSVTVETLSAYCQNRTKYKL